MEPTEQNSSKEIDNDKDVKVSVVQGRIITITTINVILVDRKPLIGSTKVTLPEGRQDVRVKKV